MIASKIKCSTFLLLLIFSVSINQSKADDAKNDSITTASNRRANKVALMSAVVPGSGQVMNKKYWKVPIIYGAGGVLAYLIHSNNIEFQKFRTALRYRNDNDSLTVDNFPRYTVEDLTVRRDYYRRNRDLSYIFAGVLYVLNIVDAYVDSQLLNFDVGDNLSMHSAPTINYLADGMAVPAFQLTLTFK